MMKRANPSSSTGILPVCPTVLNDRRQVPPDFSFSYSPKSANHVCIKRHKRDFSDAGSRENSEIKQFPHFALVDARKIRQISLVDNCTLTRTRLEK